MTAGGVDDAEVAAAHRESIEAEKAVVDALRKDGTFERVRKALIARCVADGGVRAKVAESVDASETLRQRGAAGAKFDELVDRLREEVEKDVMGAFADKAWELMTDERGEVGAMIAEAVEKRLGGR
jgi:hypothetical protein